MSAGDGSARPPFLLFRVDDRLLHGQVILGWGGPLRARGYLLADDRMAADPDAETLFAAMTPPDCAVRVRSIEEVAGDSGVDPAHTILLVRDVTAAAVLLRRGVPGPLVLGGIHGHTGARPLLPYLFLAPEEMRLLADLAREGHAIWAQDLPGSRRVDPAGLPGFDAGGMV